jgi:hypothetical protein
LQKAAFANPLDEEMGADETPFEKEPKDSPFEQEEAR